MAVFVYDKTIEPQCALCEHGKISDDGQSVICRKIGAVMQPYSKCRKYKYDPLKREPKVSPRLTEFSKEDFSL